MSELEDEAFSAFVRARSVDLQRMAWLLTGEWAAADDLVQAALLQTWRRWSAVVRRDDPLVYVRRVLMTTFLGWRRRRWTGELALGWLPDRAAHDDPAVAVADHEVVAAALVRLPRQQRAVLVLRYFIDLSEAGTAEILGCSVGSVKTHASRGLAKLRLDPTLRLATFERET